MKAVAVLSLIVLFSGAAMAQPPPAPNSVYLEGAGNGLIYSINYDRLLTRSIGGRLGFSRVKPEEFSVTTFPLTAYYLVGSGSSRMELGLGACVILQPERQSFSFMSSLDDEFKGDGVLGTAILGYRYQRAEGGIVIRAGLTPFYGTFVRETSRPFDPSDAEEVSRLKISGGLSVGYAF